jgi:hypothetical protein
MPVRKSLLLGGGIAVLAGVGIAAGVNSERINNTEYKITEIKNYENSNDKAIIYYSPSDRFSTDDNITLLNTNSTPKIDGNYSSNNIIDTGIGFIHIKSSNITQNGDSGTIKCQTNFGNQFRTVLKNDVVKQVIGVAGDVVTTAAEETKDIIGEIFKDLIGDNLWIILIVIIILILLSSSSSILFIVTKT